MKHFFLLLFICLLVPATCVFANGGFKPGDQLNVWSLNGLPLKQKPDVKSRNMIMIPYGKRVTVIAPTENQMEVLFTNDAQALYELSGEWLNVRYKGKTGYVFDGFLSKMPPVKIDRRGNPENAALYLKRNYGVASTMVKSGKTHGQASNTTTTIYNDGTKLIATRYDKCAGDQLYLKNISYPEAMLLEKILLKNAAASNVKIKKKWHHVILMSYEDCN